MTALRKRVAILISGRGSNMKALIEAAAESLTSLGLIALRREPLGSARAIYADWPGIVGNIFTWRVSAIVVFAAVLAAVVMMTRVTLGDESESRQGTKTTA